MRLVVVALTFLCLFAVFVGCTDGASEPEENTLTIDAGDPDDGGDIVEQEATEIVFPTDEFVIETGSPMGPEAQVLDQEGAVMEGAVISWESQDPSILEITSGGLALGHEIGETELVASHDGVQAQWPARVVGALVANITVVPSESTVVEGWRLPYTANLYDASNNSIDDDRSIAWSTTDETVATMDDAGYAQAHSAGEVEIVATVDGIEGRAELTVLDAEVESMEISPASPSPIYRGETVQLDAIAYDLDGDPLGGQAAQWSSSDESVATVDESGLVTGVAMGEAQISAEIDEFDDSVDINVIFSIREIGAGDGFGCAVTGHELYCWGDNDDGQLGDGTFDGREEALPADFTGDIDGLSLGASHGCLIDGGGEVWCWGANDSGQTGQPAGEPEPTPVALGAGLTFESISAGLAHSCGVTDDEQVYCWGDNSNLQLGNTGGSTEEPVAVSASVDFIEVVAGDGHTCAIGTDDTGYCWGDNQRSQLGGGTEADQLHTPTQVIGGYSFNSMSAGAQFTCGTAASGPPVCWGANDRGQLGNGNTVDQDVPLTLDLQSGESLSTIAAGAEHACGLASGGSLRCWGAPGDGRLGMDATDDVTSPQSTDIDRAFSHITMGHSHGCGRTADHEVFCWGGAPAQGASEVEVDL